MWVSSPTERNKLSQLLYPLWDCWLFLMAEYFYNLITIFVSHGLLYYCHMEGKAHSISVRQLSKTWWPSSLESQARFHSTRLIWRWVDIAIVTRPWHPSNLLPCKNLITASTSLISAFITRWSGNQYQTGVGVPEHSWQLSREGKLCHKLKKGRPHSKTIGYSFLHPPQK